MDTQRLGLWLRRGRGFLWGLLVLAYPFVSYEANASGRTGDLGLAFAFVPMLALLFGLSWSARPYVLWRTVFVLTCFALWRYRLAFMAHYSWAFLLEDVGVLSLLCLLFARTLRASQTPLISRLSVLVHGGLTPLLAHYTRRVTQLWAALFGLMAIVSVALFLGAGPAVWAFYANVLTWPIMVIVFVGEYVVRRSVVPPEQCAGFTQVIVASRRYWRSIVTSDQSPAPPSARAPQ